MKITKLRTAEIKVPLKVPFITALRRVDAVESILVCIETDEAVIGYGEAPPTKAITGETKESILDAIQNHIAPAVTGMPLEDLEGVMKALHGALPKNTSAKAAVDMAIYDLLAKKSKQPLYQYLGGTKTTIETDITISLKTPAEMAQDSLRAVQEGYKILKLKVGRGNDEDLMRVEAVRRAVGENVLLRVDANQGWEADGAIRLIRTMESKNLGIELVEQPVPAQDLDGLRHVTQNVNTPILADESMFSAEDAEKIIRTGAADLLNIKLMKTGGIYGALAICRLARQNGMECMMGCMLETKLAVSAAAHLAAAMGCITRADLDGPALCKIDPYTGGPLYEGPYIHMNQNPGIGITGVPGF